MQKCLIPNPSELTGTASTMKLLWLKMQAGQGRKKTLTSVYFDTDNFALREHGVSLRVRKIGGQRLRTIKADSSAINDLQVPHCCPRDVCGNGSRSWQPSKGYRVMTI